MAIDMGGRRQAPMAPQGPTADKVTITRAQGGGFAVECQRNGVPETSTYPDIDSTLDYAASELGGSSAPAEAAEAMPAPPAEPPY